MMFSRGIGTMVDYVMMIYSLHFALMPSLLMMMHPQTFKRPKCGSQNEKMKKKKVQHVP
jgi:hypothetical protein